jgi:5-methylcytosine-specific restriction endonuclease McrA
VTNAPKIGDLAPGPGFRDINRYKVCIACGEVYGGHYNSLYCKKQTCEDQRQKDRSFEGKARRYSKYPGVPFTESQWLALCQKFENRCLCCGRSGVELTIDHVIPLSRGGQHELSNVQPLCRHCNNKKNNKTITDYRSDVIRRLLEKWLKGEVSID